MTANPFRHWSENPSPKLANILTLLDNVEQESMLTPVSQRLHVAIIHEIHEITHRAHGNLTVLAAQELLGAVKRIHAVMQNIEHSKQIKHQNQPDTDSVEADVEAWTSQTQNQGV